MLALALKYSPWLDRSHWTRPIRSKIASQVIADIPANDRTSGVFDINPESD
jgi:hypothetical protein